MIFFLEYEFNNGFLKLIFTHQQNIPLLGMQIKSSFVYHRSKLNVCSHPAEMLLWGEIRKQKIEQILSVVLFISQIFNVKNNVNINHDIKPFQFILTQSKHHSQCSFRYQVIQHCCDVSPLLQQSKRLPVTVQDL